LAVEAVVITFQTEGWLVGVEPAGTLEPFGVKKDAAGEESVRLDLLGVLSYFLA
jgi:hypothetical protein